MPHSKRNKARTAVRASLILVSSVAITPPSGCTFPSSQDSGPDVDAIVAVVEAIYGHPAGKPTIFLGAESESDSDTAMARSAIASSLNAKVLTLADRVFDAAVPPYTPLDPDTGEPGVTIALGRFNLGEDGNLRVAASYVMQDGADRGCTEFVLAPNGRGWAVVGSSGSGWPDCVLGDEILVSYDAFVEKVHSGDCQGLSAAIGTCGPWLAIREQNIDSGRTWYFDPETRLMVGQDSYDFSIEPGEAGEATCDFDDFAQTELIICD